MTILDTIIEYKKKEVADNMRTVTASDLATSHYFERETISLSGSLLDKNRSCIIAEFKRKSPSLGMINSDASVAQVTTGYFSNGASGISVLTDQYFFGGSSSDLVIARENNSGPILRKDFIIDQYQVLQSKAIGADAILLIAATLSKTEILKLAESARSVGLEVLLEVHDHHELDKINQFINIIGVNNRNLKTFEVDVETSLRLADLIPHGFLKISESGLSCPDDIKRLKNVGYNGFLMGEKFMSSPDPVMAFSEFVNDLTRSDVKS